MEYGLRASGVRELKLCFLYTVLILVLMEYGLREAVIGLKKKYEEVLILVLMEYGLRDNVITIVNPDGTS